MRAYQQWDEINTYLALTSKRNKEIDKVAQDLCFTNSTLDKYLTDNYALWLDLQTTDDNTLHGSGRAVENSSEDITIQVSKEQGADESINVYLYIIQDAQIYFEDVRYKEVRY